MAAEEADICVGAEELEIDWAWVKNRLLEKEKIAAGKNAAAKNLVVACLDESLEEAKSCALPQAVSTVKKVVSFKPAGIEIEGGVLLSGKRFAAYLKGAPRICVFLVTIGSGLEATATRWMGGGEELRGYLLDSMGSLAVESLAEKFEQKLRQKCGLRGQGASMRLSPGYCDWPIEEQFKLAAVLDFSKAGVGLTKNCMMVPKKSISCVMGIGPVGLFSESKSQCEICDKKECDYRRTTP